MLKRYTGLSPSEMRERGGSIWLARHFVASLAAARARTRGQRPSRRHSDEYSTVA